MLMGLASSISSRPFRFAFLLSVLLWFITTASFRVQSYLFDRKVHFVLRRMEKIQLNKTSKEEVLVLVPELKPGILWSFVLNGHSEDTCPGDACYVLHIQNYPDGILAELRAKLEYRHDWIFKTAYWLGHRFRSFGAYVEVRRGQVSRYEYSLSLEDAEFPANGLVGVQVLGANRESFPGGFGFMRDYDEIGGFRIKVPSNIPTKILYVAFTPDAQPKAVRNAFDVRLDCIWNVTGCLTTRQVLPALWNEKVNSN